MVCHYCCSFQLPLRSLLCLKRPCCAGRLSAARHVYTVEHSSRFVSLFVLLPLLVLITGVVFSQEWCFLNTTSQDSYSAAYNL